jgi:hypothetical protein
MNITDYLQTINDIFEKSGINGVRVCIEIATWNSSDGFVKTYYHAHIQHDDLPDYNSGIGNSSFSYLLHKIEIQLVPELKSELTLIYT